MGRSKAYDASIADLETIYSKMRTSFEMDAEREAVAASRDEMMEEIRTALREGLVSKEVIADEIINDIMLNSSNPQDRLRAAELIKKSEMNKKGSTAGKPPSEVDIERFFRVLEETGTIREAIEERREISTQSAGAMSE